MKFCGNSHLGSRIIFFAFIFLSVVSFALSSFADPWPLGTITTSTSALSNCPAGSTSCVLFKVTCSGLPQINGYIGDKPSLIAPRGLALFMPPANGGIFWTVQFPDMIPNVEDLRSQGFAIVQVKWGSTWFLSGGNIEAGTAHVACRPATVIKYIHDNYYLPLGVSPPAPGEAGFAIASSSGGSNQVAYSLSHYGLDNMIDVALPIGGPTFATLAKSCMLNAGESIYQYDNSARSQVDRAWGHSTSGTGPCYFHNSAYLSSWLQESEATGGNDYYHPITRVQFLIGDSDLQQQAVAGDYYQQLLAGGSTNVIFQIVPNTGHKVADTAEGRQAIEDAIIGDVPPPPPPSPPSPPTNLTASAVSSSQINLAWSDNSNNEDGFKIERSTDGTNFTQIATVGTNATSYSNTGLSASTKYYYRVRAYNSAGDSDYSNTASDTTSPPPPPPSPPTNLTASGVSSSQINLAWSDNSNNEDGFYIERSTDGTNFTQIATVGTNATSYSNTGLTASTTYYYRVCAYNSSGPSAYSNIASATTPAQSLLPLPPTNLVASPITYLQINLTWKDKSTNETGFKIERSTDGTNFTQIATLSANKTSYSNYGVSGSTTYYYRVCAYNSAGNSDYSNTASATTPPPPPPPPPGVLPLGIITTSSGTNCPSGWNCRSLKIVCEGLSNIINGFIADVPALAPVRGLAFFMPGGTGIGWYSVDNPSMVPVIDELRSAGFAIVQARWNTGWIDSTQDVAAGTAHVACRPATLIRYVHDNYYLPLGVPAPQPGVAGFAVIGSSGGSNQVGYALTHYRLEDIMDVAIPVGGPTFSTLAKSCMNNAGEENYWLDVNARDIVDRAFGFMTGETGPCYFHDSSYLQRWLDESEATGGNDYYHPNTRVHFLVGDSDRGMQPIAGDYYQKLVDAGTPYVIFELVPNTAHVITDTQEGRDALKNAIEATTP